MSIVGHKDVDNKIFDLVPKYKYSLLKLVCKSWYDRFRELDSSPFDCISGCAENGELHLIQWLRENRCPWSKDTCDSAAKGGHLEVFKWAIGNGCEWTEDTS